MNGQSGLTRFKSILGFGIIHMDQYDVQYTLTMCLYTSDIYDAWQYDGIDVLQLDL